MPLDLVIFTLRYFHRPNGDAVITLGWADDDRSETAAPPHRRTTARPPHLSARPLTRPRPSPLPPWHPPMGHAEVSTTFHSNFNNIQNKWFSLFESAYLQCHIEDYKQAFNKHGHSTWLGHFFPCLHWWACKKEKLQIGVISNIVSSEISLTPLAKALLSPSRNWPPWTSHFSNWSPRTPRHARHLAPAGVEYSNCLRVQLLNDISILCLNGRWKFAFCAIFELPLKIVCTPTWSRQVSRRCLPGKFSGLGTA